VSEVEDSYPETKVSLDELPKTLKDLRKMREMTLKEVSEATGLSISFLSDMERGRVSPSLRTVQRLAQAYKAPLSVYMAGIMSEASKPFDPKSVLVFINKEGECLCAAPHEGSEDKEVYLLVMRWGEIGSIILSRDEVSRIVGAFVEWLKDTQQPYPGQLVAY
jgi:transcriptional regulator with XRE-family HTH domain